MIYTLQSKVWIRNEFNELKGFGSLRINTAKGPLVVASRHFIRLLFAPSLVWLDSSMDCAIFLIVRLYSIGLLDSFEAVLGSLAES